MRLIHSLKLMVYTLVVLGTTLSSTQYIQAKTLSADPYSVSWTNQTDEYRCTLEQDIPRFGKVVFSQTPDSDVALEIHALTALYRGSETKLKARPPSWRSDLSGFLIASNSKIGSVDTRANFSSESSKLAFKAMQDGFRLHLTLLYGSPPEKIALSVEGLGFNALLAHFERCKVESRKRQIENQLQLAAEKKAAEELALTMAKLEANTPKKAALTESTEKTALNPLEKKLEALPDYYRIPFTNKDTELSATGTEYLDQLLRRWQLGGMPEQVALHGHAGDAESTANYINSELRAQSVERYLRSKMPEINLRIKAHGDTVPSEELSTQRVDVVPSDLPDWE